MVLCLPEHTQSQPIVTHDTFLSHLVYGWKLEAYILKLIHMTFKQNLTEKSTKKTKIRLELH